MKSSSKSAPNVAAKKSKKASSARKFIFTVVKFLAIFFAAVIFAISGIVGGAIYGYIMTAEPIRDEQLSAKVSNQTTFLYDTKGNIIQKLTGKDNMDSEPITDKEAPYFLKKAIIAIEDERFEDHHGIDIKGIFNAGLSFAESIFTNNDKATRGGSTITQQVVKNITGNTKRSLQRKVQEWYAAIQLERKLDKWQILELYMNLSYWGNSCNGVQSASKKYFGKPVQELSLAQCALLAGITNSPGRNNPFTETGRKNAKNRQVTILGKMLELRMIDQSQYDQAINEDLKYAPKSQSQKVSSVQSYFVDQVIIDVRNALMKEYNISSTMANYMIYGGGLEIYTTMNSEIQSAMNQVFMDGSYFPLVNETAKKQMEHPQSSMAIIDVQNGQVKALYGGYGKKEASNTLNRASSALMKRQPGSSIKPLVVYAPAIDKELITPATIVDDIPVYMLTGKDAEKEYPENYTNEYEGLTSVRNALKSSVNVVAAKIWRDILGIDNSIDYLKKVGLDREKERYVSLVMGGLENGVNPLQMAAAYVPFARKGIYYEPTTYTLVKNSAGKTLIDKKAANFSIAYSEQTAFIMTDLMKEVTLGKTPPYPHSGTAARYVNEKTVGMMVAGKTGTTNSNIDKWFVGYTPYYAAAAWYGYDNPGKPIALEEKEYNQAMIIWAAVMQKVHTGLAQKSFEMPLGIVQKNVCIYSGKIATELCTRDPRGNAKKTEYFIKNTEPRDDDLCTLHVETQVCTESQDIYKRNLLAGPNCPLDKVVKNVFIQRSTPYTPIMPNEPPPEDIAYELPAGEYCAIHGAQITTGSAIDITDTLLLPGSGGAQPTPGSGGAQPTPSSGGIQPTLGSGGIQPTPGSGGTLSGLAMQF